jgi:hypothetical protein
MPSRLFFKTPNLDFDAALDGITLPPRVVEKITRMPESNRDTLMRLVQHMRVIEDMCPEDESGSLTLDRLSRVFGPLLFGVEETEANARAVDLASCFVKLLLTHPALATIATN